LVPAGALICPLTRAPCGSGGWPIQVALCFACCFSALARAEAQNASPHSRPIGSQRFHSLSRLAWKPPKANCQGQRFASSRNGGQCGERERERACGERSENLPTTKSDGQRDVFRRPLSFSLPTLGPVSWPPSGQRPVGRGQSGAKSKSIGRQSLCCEWPLTMDATGCNLWPPVGPLGVLLSHVAAFHSF